MDLRKFFGGAAVSVSLLVSSWGLDVKASELGVADGEDDRRNVQTVAQAVDSIRKNPVLYNKKQAEKILPRPAFKSVPSMVGTGETAFPLDTLETSDTHVKIVLYADNSWKYVRDPEYVMDQDAFKASWNNQYPNPYHASLDSMPSKITLWLVDSTSQYSCPFQTKVYSPFGYRHGRNHNGVDLPLRTGTDVHAAFAGKVRMSKYYKGYGNLVVIRHENGLETFYAHLSKRLVNEGDWVTAGQIIGLGGSTGRSTGAHLHFETRYQGYAFDPQWIVDFENGSLRSRAFVLKKKYLSARSKYVPEDDDEDALIMAADSTEYAAIAAQKAAEKAAEEAKRYYKIRSGDTLSKIASRNGTSVNAICKLNGITTRTVLKIGRTIRVR